MLHIEIQKDTIPAISRNLNRQTVLYTLGKILKGPILYKKNYIFLAKGALPKVLDAVHFNNFHEYSSYGCS